MSSIRRYGNCTFNLNFVTLISVHDKCLNINFTNSVVKHVIHFDTVEMANNVFNELSEFMYNYYTEFVPVNQ